MRTILALASLLLLTVTTVHGACTDVPNCNSCENPGPECLSCASNKVLSADHKTCRDCPTDCAKCELVDDEPSCVECASGRLDEGACTACTLDDCNLCHMDGEEEMCDECDDTGFTLSGGVCSGCPNGKYLDGTCKACPSNAVTCSSGGTVTLCKNDGIGYVKADDSLSCKACPSGCVKCALDGTDAKCTECPETQYVTDSGDCDYCTGDSSSDDKCHTCGAEGECEECNPEFYLLDDGTCAACPANCDGCAENEDGDVECDTCSDQYGLNEEILCEKCGANCVSCPNGECDTCAAGYALHDDKTCKTCPALCLTCEYTGASVVGEETCLTCEGDAELGLNADDAVQCQTLPTGCLTLITVVGNLAAGGARPQCATCETDFYVLDAENDCIGCKTAGTGGTTNCDTCTSAAADSVTCTACEAGYILETGTPGCDSCTTATTGGIANCDTCTSTAADSVTCTACKAGYALDSGTDTCVSCETAANGGDEHCSACTASDATTVVCDTCKADAITYESTVGAVCGDACPSNCKANKCDLEANAKVTCNECENGYRLAYNDGTATGKCTKCTGNCELCTPVTEDNSQTCTDCDDAYVLVEGACEACPEHCELCTSSDGELECTTCEGGYGKDADGNCLACILNCDECDADGDGIQKCTQCVNLYFENEDQCVACSSNCLECSYDVGNMDCGKCADGYVLNSGSCDKCPSSCTECSSATKCKPGECSFGYAVNDAGECQDCATLTAIGNCALCSEKPNANSSAPCLACTTGFTLQDALQTGEDAECISTSELQCGVGGMMSDRPPICDKDSCTDDTFITVDDQCGRRCYVCGDYENNGFVSVESCKTDNSSGVIALCPSGYCAMVSVNTGGVVTVSGGCLSVDETCENEDTSCKNVENVEECKKCCGTNECLQEALTTGLEAENLAPAANSASFFLLCSISALTLLFSRG